ncbi:MAG: hypothetical protein AAB426_00465 [Myxococcota bacterium]
MARHRAQYLVGAILLVACSTTKAPAPFQSPEAYRANGANEKIVFLPAHIAFEIDGDIAEGRQADAAALAVQGALEQALAREHYAQRYVFASDAAAVKASHEVSHWLNTVNVCAASEVTPSGRLEGLTPLLHALGGNAAVFVGGRAHLRTQARKAEQIVAGTLIAAAAVAIVALVVYAVAEQDNPPHCSGPTIGAPSPETIDVTARVALDEVDRQRAREVRCERLALPDDGHGFWTGSHLDLAVAVVGADGVLLWYRTGQLPLDTKNGHKSGRMLARFLRGMP